MYRTPPTLPINKRVEDNHLHTPKPFPLSISHNLISSALILLHKQLMADKLPKYIVIQSVVTGEYVYYIDSGDLRGYARCKEPSVFGTFAKIQVEPSKTNPDYVHLRFCSSNRYWATITTSSDTDWILANSSKAEEDTSKEECTLFEPFFEGGNLLFSHVHSGGRVGNYVEQTGSDGFRLYVHGRSKATSTESFAFKYVDWDTLVGLPKRVAFKGDNDLFLTAYEDYVSFSSDDGNNSHSAFIIEYTPDGYVLVMAERYRKYLRNTHNWIKYDTSDGSGKDETTLFWPVKIDQHTIALKSKSNNQFCIRLTLDGKTSCLNAADSYISNKAKMRVEELVLERTIYNVRYRMEDARISDEKPFLAGIGSASNESDNESILTIRIAYETVSSYEFTSSVSIKAGVSTKIETGIPSIAEGAIEVSLEVSVGFEWGKTTEQKQVAEVLYSVKVPPRKKATVNYVGTHGKCSVPFTYTRKDKRSSDGNFVTSVHDDGIFTGVNYYSYRFEHLPLESI